MEFPNRNFSRKMGRRARGRKWEEGARNHRILLAGKALEYHPAQPWKNCGEQRGWILPHLGNEEQLPGGFPSKKIFPHGVPSPGPQYPDPNPSLPSTWSCLESKQFPVPPSHMSAAPREFLPKQSRDRVLWLPRSDPREQRNETLLFPSFRSREKGNVEKSCRQQLDEASPKDPNPHWNLSPPLGSASKREKCSSWDHFRCL